MRTCAIAAILSAALFVPAVSIAATPTTQPTAPTNNRNTNRANRPARSATTRTAPARPAAATPAALGSDTAANQELAADRAALDQAASACNTLIDGLIKTFEATPDMAAALQQRSEAAAKLATLKPPVIEKAKASAEYQKISADIEKDTKHLWQLRSDAAADSEIAAAAQKLADEDAAHDKVIKDALAADKEIAIAQALYDVADGKANKLRADFTKSLENNDEVLKAKSAVATARANFDDAKKRLSMTSTP